MSKSTFEKLDILDVIPSSKTDMDTRHGLETHQDNGKEEGAIATSLPSTSLSTMSSPSTVSPSTVSPSTFSPSMSSPSTTMQQSESFISDNPDASSPLKQIMDTRKDLETDRNYDEDKQAGSGNLRPIYSTIQNPKYPSPKKQWPTSNKIEWNILCNCKCMGCSVCNICNEPGESKIEKNDPQEVIQLRGISNWASGTDRPVDIDLGTQRRHDTNNIKRIMEIDNSSEKNQGIFWSLSHISKAKREEADSHISAGDKSPPFSPGSGRESASKFNKFQVWKLLRDQHLVPFSKNEARDSNQNLHDQHFLWNSNVFLSKLPEIPNQLLDLLRTEHHGIHKITSKDSLKYVWRPGLLKHFSERFKITNPHPVFIDDSGYVCIMIDEHGCVFMWNEMEKDMQYLGPDLITGIKNLLFYPDNILYDSLISDEPEFDDEEEEGEEAPMAKVFILKMGTKGNKGKKKKRKNKSKKNK